MKCREKSHQGKQFIANFHLGLHHCSVASCMHVCYTVKDDAGNHNSGKSATEGRKMSEFHAVSGQPGKDVRIGTVNDKCVLRPV